MQIAGHAYDVMSLEEMELIHHSALRILDEMGMEVQNRTLLEVLANFGLPTDFSGQRVWKSLASAGGPSQARSAV